jgi:hypothetical protein
VRGTHRTSSPVDGAADRGAKARRDGCVCGKREEGRSAASQAAGEKRGEEMGGASRGGATRHGGGVGPGSDRRAASRPWPGRQRRAGADVRAPVVVRVERRARVRGLAREENGVAKPR